MTLQGIEGKLFAPLALTIVMALAVSLAVSLLLSPVLCSYILKGGADHDTRVIAVLKRAYLKLLDRALSRQHATLGVAVALLLGSLALFPFLGKSFMPTMKEGALTPQINRVPSISLDESIRLEMGAMKAIAQVPGVRMVVSKLGRGESPADPGRAQRVRPDRVARSQVGAYPGRNRRGYPPAPVLHSGRADRAVAADCRARGRDGDRRALATGGQDFWR